MLHPLPLTHPNQIKAEKVFAFFNFPVLLALVGSVKHIELRRLLLLNKEMTYSRNTWTEDNQESGKHRLVEVVH